ncbi:MAG: PAS domain S-box protein [Bacteroidota bacterium]
MLKNISFHSFQDPELTRKASNLFKIILGGMVFVVLTFSIAIYKQNEYATRYLSIILVTCLISSTILFFLRKGYVKTSAYTYIIFLLLMIIGFSWTGGGIKGHGIGLLPIVVLFAGLTIGRKAIWVFGIIASLGGLFFVIADYYQILPVNNPLGNSALIYWVYSTTGIFLLCYLEHLSVGGLNKALNESRAELTLRRKSEEKYRLIFESFQDIYYQSDADGKILIITPSVKTHTGYDPSEVVGRDVSEFYVNPENRNAFLSELKLTGSLQNYELDFLAKDGSIINAIVSSQILYDNNGNPKTIEGTIHDITQRKQAEDMLKLKNKKLTEIAFLQSHIVRRPVANVMGLVNLINKEDPTDPINFELIPKLAIASKELDEVIKQIVQKTTEIERID